jgi:hypothetical protein
MAQKERLHINNLVTPADTTWEFGTAAPTVGAHKVGDTVFNTAPAAGGVFAWVCTTAGTPGTWKEVAVGA